jgi:DNA-binding response OmpR family regulator
MGFSSLIQGSPMTTLRQILLISSSTDLLIEDLSIQLPPSEFELITAKDIEAARQWLKNEGLPHLMIIDLSPPNTAGLQFAEQMYAVAGMPIITIAENNDPPQQIVLEALKYTDDFIRRDDVSSEELAMRIRRILSRVQNFSYASGSQVQIAEGITIDPVKRELVVHGSIRLLSPTENALLNVLLVNRGQFVDAKTLINRIWHLDPSAKDWNALRVHMHRLRRKLEKDPEHPQLIMTERGTGYRLVEE